MIALEVNVQFGFDSAEITSAYDSEIGVSAAAMRENPNIRAIVEGNTDSVGDAAYNQQLSEARVASVREVLEQTGLDPQRIQIAAWGESESRAMEGDLDGYALERKVRVRLVAPPSAMSARSSDQ